VSNLSNLSDLSVKIISALDDINVHSLFILDSISTLLIYNSENEVARFLEINMARMKHNNHVSVWVIELGIHSGQFYNTLRHMADCILEMRFEEQGELLRYIRMHTFKGLRHNTTWRKFLIDEKGDMAILRD
jgi:KaiC/GvpD/RAD55 family RecA-like ATPase